MKLLALRVSAFRRFAQGVAVENFAAGVNLLSGPNELGKSTLFQALEAAFLFKNGTSGAVLEGMRPRGGGEPLVEADFEMDGRRWRIRKQFGRGKGAILSDLDSGRDIARASEAEDQLAALIGARSDVPGRIGLVWVRQQRALQPPDLDVEPATGKAKPRGETNALLDLLNAEVIEAAGSGLAERIAKRAQADLDALVTMRGAKKGGAYDVALTAREQARAQLERARASASASEQRLERIAKSTQLLSGLEDPAARAALAERIDVLERAVSEAGAQRERHKALADQVTARDLEAREARRALVEAHALGERARGVAEALGNAKALGKTVAALSEALNANLATPPRLSALETAFTLAQREEQALGDMSTFVDVSPVAGATARIVADGTPIATETRLAVPEQVMLTIAGVGSIRVTSSDAKRAAAAKRRRDEQQAVIACVMREMGVRDLEQARVLAAQRQKAVLELDDARRSLSAAAPRGVGMLESESVQLQASVGALDVNSLDAAASEREAQALAARHALEQAKSGAIDEERFRRLNADLAAAKQEIQRRQETIRRYSEDLARLKGEQAAADEQSGAANPVAAQEALGAAEARVRRCEDDIAALKLLTETLTGRIENVRTRYLEPISRAFLPYLTRVFPGAAPDFREGFSLQALTRAGQQEEFATLSDGTREQLAVLVRLGFARLFADRGSPVPLVLDDPLVYSDDQRLAAMCAVLNEAGTRHQVVVLTCRESAFSQLGAHRLALAPWRDALG